MNLPLVKRNIERFLPRKALDIYRRWHFRSGYRRGKRTWSQEGEDILLERWFGGVSGFYIDVGAHHPYRYSNTYLLYRSGWHGINIDASPTTIKLFEHDRGSDINICIGVDEHPGRIEYYEFNDSALNTFNPDVAKRVPLLAPHAKLLGTREVDVLPLTAILDRWLPKGQNIDLLDVDVEGLDLAVLRSNDWARYRPRVILAEVQWATLEQVAAHPLVRFLHGKGYRLLSKCINTLMFIENGVAQLKTDDL